MIVLGIVSVFVAGAFMIGTGAVNVNQDLTLTKSQLDNLIEFRKNVVPRLDKDYQKTDIYLIRWLRAKNYNVQAAEKMLTADLIWREKNGIDDLQDQDWSDMEDEFPYYIDGLDNEGRPILTANYDEWDVRRAALAGKIPRLMLWMTKGMEEVTEKVRQLQAEGKNVTQYDYIINMNNFNVVQHMCLSCLPIYTNFISTYENHYPGSADKIIGLNTPQIFESVLSLVRPIMSPQTRDALKIYSNLKEEWESKLFKDVERDQLVKEFGGTKVRSYKF